MERKTYTVEEVGELLGIGRNSAYEAVKTGQVPAIRIGKRLLVPRAALERLLAQQTALTDTVPALITNTETR